MKRVLKCFVAVVALFSYASSFAALPTLPIKLHSHNDYLLDVPFYQAFGQGVSSIEADVYYVDGELLVGHEVEQLDPLRSFETLYLNPIVQQFKLNGGKAWSSREDQLQLMVDLKSATEPTLSALVKMLDQYPEVFDPAKNSSAVRVVITGKVPSPAEFDNYPSYILFDGDLSTEYTEAQLARVGLISLNFQEYASWNGKGLMLASHFEQVVDAIHKVHDMGKEIRFWWAPDGATVWYTFYNLGVDYLSSNNIGNCIEFLRNYPSKFYQMGSVAASTEMARAKKLDKATRGFAGFDSSKLRIDEPISVYLPTYLNDGKEGKIRNVILMIGDGMGLSQVYATTVVNKGLSMLNLKHIGLQSTSSKDAFTTDSAAAGSALATGVLHSNRHISADEDNNPVESITEILSARGYKCGVITAGCSVDATPAAYYGHTTERDSSEVISRGLLKGHIDLLCGSDGKAVLFKNDEIDMKKELTKMKYDVVDNIDDINPKKRVICLDERLGAAASQENLTLLADATRAGIELLDKKRSEGFFLMVEAAKIDYAGHARTMPGVVVETLAFDLAIAEALRFADSNGETLVIITGDHETGGLVVMDGSIDHQAVMGYFVTDDHTATPLPVYSYGPGAQEFTGYYENVEIIRRIKSLLKVN